MRNNLVGNISGLPERVEGSIGAVGLSDAALAYDFGHSGQSLGLDPSADSTFTPTP